MIIRAKIIKQFCNTRCVWFASVGQNVSFQMFCYVFVQRTADRIWFIEGKFPFISVFFLCVCASAQDPHLRNLESMFALQQKIVEAAFKLASEGDLCKTVRKKRRNNYLDAKRKLGEIDREINAYRIKKGQKPTQRASLVLAGTER